jgi:hypothetical protein
VPLGTGASRVSCGFAPPGLTAGLAAGGTAAAVLLGVAVVTAVRRRSVRPAGEGPVPSE